jgi:spore maturation protein CgeB
MQSSKICYNELISYGINAKYFEIIASGSFMLAQENSNFLEYVDNNQYIQKMFFKDEKDFQDKITYYLENEVERENICKIARKYVLERHTWESRMINLLDELKRINII